MSVIEPFLRNYSRQFDFYQKISQLCAQQCEAGLESLGIRAIVTYRAKRLDRLEEKLENRIQEGKRYDSEEDVRKDVFDLAGVRIALYFPGDQEEVGKFIETQFDKVKESKVFPTGSERDGYPYKFSGYSAWHYFVQLKPSALAATQKQYCTSPIEIQVASVLMHAWAEVEHDLVYKHLRGTVSENEHAILDELNGMVLAGEIVLERLQKAVETRVAEKTRRFSNHYELASYLVESTKWIQGGQLSEPSMGRVDLLYRLLEKADMNKPDKIAPIIKSMKTISEQRPISEQVADAILVSKPELYHEYEKIRREQGLRIQTAVGKRPGKTEEGIRYFLGQWFELEKYVTALIRQRIPKARPYLILSPTYLKTLGLFDRETLDELSRFRRLRTMVVHGDIPPDVSLMQERKALEAFVEKLKEKYPIGQPSKRT